MIRGGGFSWGTADVAFFWREMTKKWKSGMKRNWNSGKTKYRKDGILE